MLYSFLFGLGKRCEEGGLVIAMDNATYYNGEQYLNIVRGVKRVGFEIVLSTTQYMCP